VSVTGFDTALASSSKAKLVDSTVVGSGNPGHGIEAGNDKAILVRSTVSGFGSYGVYAFAIRLIDSNVTGNGQDPACTGACADLVSIDRGPVLRGTSSCGSSIDPFTGVPWGVCASD
jgi:hypothetical protein